MGKYIRYFGITSLSNLPYHIYFILFLVLIFTLSYWYHRHMAQTKYQHYPMTKINNENNKTNHLLATHK